MISTILGLILFLPFFIFLILVAIAAVIFFIQLWLIPFQILYELFFG